MRLEGIDLLRGTAVGSVVLYHYFVLMHLQNHPLFPYIHTFGLFGVSLFFVISGYLIYRSITARVAEWGWKRGVAIYALHRFFRIVPAYYVNLAAVALMALIFGTVQLPIDDFLRYLAAHAAFVSYFTHKDAGFGINGAYWTLHVEMLWYLLAPLLAALLAKRGWILPLLAMGSLLYLYMLQTGRLDAWLNIPPNAVALRFYYAFQLPGQFIFFAAGIAVYLYHDRLRKSRRSGILALAWGVLILLYALLQRYLSPLLFAYENLFILLFAVALFILLSHATIAVLKPISWIGEISYSVYLWHMPILFLFNKFPHDPATTAVTYPIVLIIVSAASYYGVERWGFKRQKKYEARLRRYNGGKKEGRE